MSATGTEQQQALARQFAEQQIDRGHIDSELISTAIADKHYARDRVWWTRVETAIQNRDQKGVYDAIREAIAERLECDAYAVGDEP